MSKYSAAPKEVDGFSDRASMREVFLLGSMLNLEFKGLPK